MSQFAKFCLIGVSNTLLSYIVLQFALNLLPAISFRAFFAQALSYLIGVIWSYTLNSRYTFSNGLTDKKAFARFVVLQASLMLATATAFEWLVGRGFPETPSWLGVIAFAVGINFILSKHWVFRTSTSKGWMAKDHEG